uniref:Ig-like domain-containing protein n=1 Tax=Anopheles quadriannulatus TaxID=34691 RepID=A0A182XFV8_ANOQN
AHKRDLNNLYQVIYYGDSQVEVGKPFSISCIISIANPVEWHKDGEPIRKHSNIRHGKDEHSYIESEMGIAGNRDKIEASISVQRALPKHQGRYQCNALYKNYHQLYVYRNGTLLGHGAGAAAAAVPGPSRGRDEMQVLLSTVKSTLVAPLQQPVEHHHFTTAVALAPGPPIVDEELPREHERDRESPKGGHSPHHHRQQAGQGHRHHTASGGVAGEKQPDHSSPGKDDSKRFVSQKTTTIDQNGLLPAEELLEQTQVEDLDRDFAPVLHNTDHRGASPMMGKGSKKQHSSAGRVHVPVETREEDVDEQEEMIGGGDVAEAREALDLDTAGTDADHAEDLVEPDTEIVIESKAISLEDENIDRLIQNKSDINGIILVDSLEELATLRKQPSSALLPILPTREAMMSNGSSGFSLAVSTVGPMLIGAGAIQQQGAVSKDGGSVMLLTSIAPPLEQDNTVHHNHHHHHHEHHGSSPLSSSTAAKMATTLTATTSTTTTTASTTTITATTTTSTTTTAAPPTTTTIAAAATIENFAFNFAQATNRVRDQQPRAAEL